MKINELEVCFMDQSGRTILKKKLTGLPLKENYIIAKSTEWFDDPEPCMIHRSAVMKTLYIELFNYFDQLLQQSVNRQNWCDVPDHLKQMIDIDMKISYILLNV